MPLHRTPCRAAVGLLLGASLTLPANVARAQQSFTWTGTSSNPPSGLWSNNQNWSSFTFPSSNASTSLLFNGTAQISSVADFPTTFQLNSLTFGANAGNYILSGRQVGAGQTTLSFLAPTFSAQPAITVAGAADVRVYTNVSLNGNNLSVAVAPGGTLTFGYQTSGGGQIVKRGAGTLALRVGSQTNAHSVLRIEDGTVAANSALALGNNGVDILAGGTLRADTAVDQTFLNKISSGSNGSLLLGADSDNDLDFRPNGGGSLRIGAAGDVRYGGRITPVQTIAPQVRLGGGGGTLTLTANDALAPGSRLNVAGPGKVVLAGTNSLSGFVSITDGGTLQLNSLAAIGVAGITGQASGTLVANYAVDQGTLNRLSDYMGRLHLTTDTAASLAFHGGSPVRLGATQGATVRLDGAITAGQSGVGTSLYRFGGGGGTLIIGQAGALANRNGTVASVDIAGPGTIVFDQLQSYTGTTTLSDGAALRFNTMPTTSGPANILLNAGTSLITGAPLRGELLSRIATNSTGQVLLTTNTDFFLGPANLPGVRFGAIGNVQHTNSFGPAFDPTLPGGAGWIFRLGGGGGTFTVSRLLESELGISSARLNVAGAGRLILNGFNSHTGGTTVENGGTLQVNRLQALGGAPAGASLANVLVQAGGTLVAGYAPNSTLLARINPASAGQLNLGVNTGSPGGGVLLDFGAYSLDGLRLGADGAVTFTGSIVPAGGVYRLGGSGTLTLNGGLYDPAASVDIAGPGTVVYSNRQIYDGATTVRDGGTLRVESGIHLTSLTPASIEVRAGAIFEAGYLAGGETLLKLNPASAGVLALTVNDFSSGDFSLFNLPNLRLGAVGDVTTSRPMTPASLGDGAYGFKFGGAPGTLNLAGALFNGPGVGASVDVAGPGTVALLGAKGYAGGTTVRDGGTLRITQDASLGVAGTFAPSTTGRVLLDGGTLQAATGANVDLVLGRQIQLGDRGGTIDTNSGTVTVNGYVLGSSGKLTKIGAGTLVMNSRLPGYGGGTQIDQGVLLANVVPPSIPTNAPPRPSVGGDGPNVLVNQGGVFAAGYAIDQNFLARVDPRSTGVIALGANSDGATGNGILDFGTFGNALNRPGVRLGSIGDFTFSGFVAPAAVKPVPSPRYQYRLGGGGGRLTLTQELFDVSDPSVPFSPPLVPVSVDIAGPGTINLTAASSYSGGTVINSGTLRVNNTTGSGTGSGTVQVRSGATLGGAGSIGGQVIVDPGGILDPGNSIGTLGMSSLLVGAGSVLQIEFGTTGASDLLDIAGRFDFATPTGAGQVLVGVSDLGGLSVGTEYRIAEFSLNGTNMTAASFKPTPFGSLAAVDGGFAIVNDGVNSYLAFTPFSFTAVPEPSTWVLLTSGAGCLLLLRRRARRATPQAGHDA